MGTLRSAIGPAHARCIAADGSSSVGWRTGYRSSSDPKKGWCLRTLSFIRKDDFIMEYVAERISISRDRERTQINPDFEVYVMDPFDKKQNGFALDALDVRNHAAFAAFACRKQFANMRKEKLLTTHWDPFVPHVGFYAKRDIQPGEELSYMRTDVEDCSSQLNCACGHPDCRKLL